MTSVRKGMLNFLIIVTLIAIGITSAAMLMPRSQSDDHFKVSGYVETMEATQGIPYSLMSDRNDIVNAHGLATGMVVMPTDVDVAYMQAAQPVDGEGCHCIVRLYGNSSKVKPTTAAGVITVTGRGRDAIVEWKANDTERIEVRVNSPDGDLFSSTVYNKDSPFQDAGFASWRGLDWTVPGTWFYLQDVSKGKALVKQNTLAVAVVK